MKTSTFQIVVSGLFVLLLLAGIGVFAAMGGLTGGSSAGAVTIWGTLDAAVVEPVLTSLRSQGNTLEDTTYVRLEPATYEATLINAMAAGQGPDLFLASQEQIGQFADKIVVVPYGNYSQGIYTASFVDEGQLFLTGQGILALPLLLDPLVMYWNRDLFASAGLASAPQYWNDLLTIAPKITSLDASKNVKRSAVALGQWSNVANAKAILSTLMMQAGDPIVARGQDGGLVATLGSASSAGGENPASSALRFYTEFTNPSKTTYSWNRALRNSRDAFAAGELALYFGFASEYRGISARNPNLNFGVGLVPQLQAGGTRLTFGHIIGLAVPRGSQNIEGAFKVAQALSSAGAASAVAASAGLPPVRRDAPLNTSANAAMEVFVQSALIARGWLDPNPAATDNLFKAMIESVISGKEEPSQAVFNSREVLEQLLGR